RCDIGENQSAKLGDMLPVKQSIVHHLEWDARLDERLVKAERRIVDEGFGFLSAIERRRLLRVDHTDAHEVFLIMKISLVGIVPLVDLLDDRQPSMIDDFGIELGKPGAKTLRHAAGDPETRFISGLY